jgi:outer membrane usher protein
MISLLIKKNPSPFSAVPSSVLFLVAFCLVFLPCAVSDVSAGEIIIVETRLNTEKKPDIFVVLQEDGDFLLRTVDLEAMGVRKITGRRIVVDDEVYVSLRAMPGLAFVFEEATLTLDIAVDPELLPLAVVDLLPRPRQSVYRSNEDSLFFNYGLDYEAGTIAGGGLKLQSFNLSNELGIRKKDILFFTDTLYHETPHESSFVRRNTNLTFDQRDRMRRFVVGDSVAFSGNLGSRISFAGFSVSKNYRLDPYFLESPFFNYSGLVSLPAELVIYSGGVRLRREELPPGRFELRNFHNTGGAQDIVLEITDALGRVRKIYSPFYFSNLMLRAGLSEYSYNLGTLRRDYGLEESSYAHAVFSAYHRYGFSDNLNLGYRTEAGNDLVNFGVESLLAVNKYGILGLDLSASDAEDGSGWASLLRYEYRNRNYNVRFAWRNFSEEYQSFERQEALTRKASELRFGIGMVGRKFGSVALDIARTGYQAAGDENLVAISYAKRLNRALHLTGTVRHLDNGEARNEIFLSLNYYFDREHTVSSSIRQAKKSNVQAVEVRKDIPVGEGWGWWNLLERKDTGASETYTINPGGQWNAPYGIYRGEVNLNTQNESFRIAASGAVVSLGGAYGFTRPVTDSFGLVKVKDLEGVRVYSNGQEMGRTDEQGQVFIPNLTSFYQNRISIEDEDIPIDYLMLQVEKNVSPPFRSGSCVSFPVERYQAFTGVLTDHKEGKPLEFYEGQFSGARRAITFFTGSGGEFYFDNDPGSIEESDAGFAEEGCAALSGDSSGVFHPGTYQGQARSESGEVCRFRLQVPATDERYFDLGEIACSPVPETVAPLENGARMDSVPNRMVDPPAEKPSAGGEEGQSGQLPESAARGEAGAE